MRLSFSRGVGLAAAFFAAACSSDNTAPNSPPPTRSPSELNIIALAQNSPPVWNPTVTFWALKGEDREARIFFQDAVGGQGEEYLRLTIRDDALLARPDGTPIAYGDSVLITVRVVDAQQILFELEPSGLTFSPLEPAELEIDYGEADDDFNQDGVVDAEDAAIEDELSIWRQETPGGPFEKVASFTIEEFTEIKADLLGFSRYAIAY